MTMIPATPRVSVAELRSARRLDVPAVPLERKRLGPPVQLAQSVEPLTVPPWVVGGAVVAALLVVVAVVRR